MRRACFAFAALAALAWLAGGCPGETDLCSSGACDGPDPGIDGAGDGGDGGPGDGGGDSGPDALQSGFKEGNVYVAGSRNAEVFELDPALKLVTRWTHPSFGTVLPAPGQPLDQGPAGMVFDARGFLVVAGVKDFCVFSAPGVEVGCHAKTKSQPTENIIFDHLGNLYTTTSTGGTNEVHKYDAAYNYVTTFSIKTGELTGITCDPTGDLYIASQDTGSGHIYKVDRKTFAVIDTIDVAVSGIGSLEGLQYLKGGSILVATFAGNQGILKVRASSPLVVESQITDATMYGAVPVTIDNNGNIYTADYENGSGTAPADLYVFDPAGKLIASNKGSPVYGPFGMVVAGAVLPCGAYQIE